MPRRSQVRLGRRKVNELKRTTPAGKELKVFDCDLAGFGIRFSKGGAVSWIVQYRNASGRTRRYTIGPEESFTPEQAREKAQEVRAMVSEGGDPLEERKSLKGSKRVAELVANRLKSLQGKTTPRGYRETERTLGKISERFGARSWWDISREDVERWHRSMSDGAPVEANRLLTRLRALLETAARSDQKTASRLSWSNPCSGVERNPERRRKVYLGEAELARLGQAVREAEEEGTEHPSVIGAIRLLVLTGARRSEVLSLRWSYVDFEDSCFRLSTSKTGPKVIPLGAAALEVLARMRESFRMKDNPYVVPGTREGKPWYNLDKPWRRICDRADLYFENETGERERYRLHDLRHSFASHAVRHDLPLAIVGAVLGHASAATTERYAHVGKSPQKDAADRTAGIIAGHLAGDEGAEVVDFGRRRKNR